MSEVNKVRFLTSDDFVSEEFIRGAAHFVYRPHFVGDMNTVISHKFNTIRMPDKGGRVMRFRRFSRLDELKGRFMGLFNRKHREENKELYKRIAELEESVIALRSHNKYVLDLKFENFRTSLEVLEAIVGRVPYKFVNSAAYGDEISKEGYKLAGYTKANDSEIWVKR
jgi:hypothetical protein